MQNISIAILFLLGLTLISCEKDDTNFIQGRSNIVGEWTVSHSVQEIRADTVYSESGFNFQITFNSDGKGHRNNIFNDEIIFDWYYQFEPETVILIQKKVGIIFEDTQAYSVLKNESEGQIWYYEVKDLNFIADVYKNTWVMTKN